MQQVTRDNPEEVQILFALKSGDRSAFEHIYQFYSPRIYLNILKIVKSRDDAQEILQDVFIKVWQKRELIDPEKAFNSYLYQISRFTVYNFIRSTKVERSLKAYLSAQNSEIYTHVEEAISYKESDNLISNLIEELPPQRKQIFRLCKLEGESYAKVAEKLAVSPSTINDHIVKATKFLKKRYSSLGSFTLLIAFVSFLKNL